MKPVDDMPDGVDERTERLICRLLDGEIAADEQAVIEQILSSNPAAKALFDDYRQIDVRAADALRHDFARPDMTPAPRRRSSLWLATVGGLLAAAAVVAISFLPAALSTSGGGGRRHPDIALVQPRVSDGVVAGPGRIASQLPQYVDYSNAAQPPVRRLRQVRHDWIGIPGNDPNTILIIERNAQKTTITPISGDL